MSQTTNGGGVFAVKRCIRMGITFVLVVIGWVIFRSADMHECIFYLKRMFTFSLFTLPDKAALTFDTLIAFGSIAFLLVMEWKSRQEQYGFKLKRTPGILRWSLYLILALICFVSYKENQDFIYFQF